MISAARPLSRTVKTVPVTCITIEYGFICIFPMQERLKLQISKESTAAKDKVFIGPNILQLFLDSFRSIFMKKTEEHYSTNNQLT